MQRGYDGLRPRPKRTAHNQSASEAFEQPHAPDQPIDPLRIYALLNCAHAQHIDRSFNRAANRQPTPLVDHSGSQQ